MNDLTEQIKNEWMIYGGGALERGYGGKGSVKAAIDAAKSCVNGNCLHWAIAVNVNTGEEVHVFKTFDPNSWAVTKINAELIELKKCV